MLNLAILIDMGGSPLEGPDIRPVVISDLELIADFVHDQLERPQSPRDLMPYVAEYPACLAAKDDRIVGFAYCGPFGPDILELRNLVVDRNSRREGIGSRLVAALEDLAGPEVAGIVLVNSDLYPGHDTELDARSFYEANGYVLIFNTGASRVFAKRLQ